MSLHPIIKWAQRKQMVIITLGQRDVMNEKVILKDNTLQFQCQAQGKHYEFKVEFYGDVDEDKSQWNKTGFQMNFIFAKKEGSQTYWPRLTKQNKKSQYIQCDWDKWIDQDQQKEDGLRGLQNVNIDNMNNFNDSDDEQQEQSKPPSNIKVKQNIEQK